MFRGYLEDLSAAVREAVDTVSPTEVWKETSTCAMATLYHAGQRHGGCHHRRAACCFFRAVSANLAAGRLQPTGDRHPDMTDRGRS